MGFFDFFKEKAKQPEIDRIEQRRLNSISRSEQINRDIETMLRSMGLVHNTSTWPEICARIYLDEKENIDLVYLKEVTEKAVNKIKDSPRFVRGNIHDPIELNFAPKLLCKGDSVGYRVEVELINDDWGNHFRKKELIKQHKSKYDIEGLIKKEIAENTFENINSKESLDRYRSLGVARNKARSYSMGRGLCGMYMDIPDRLEVRASEIEGAEELVHRRIETEIGIERGFLITINLLLVPELRK